LKMEELTCMVCGLAQWPQCWDDGVIVETYVAVTGALSDLRDGGLLFVARAVDWSQAILFCYLSLSTLRQFLSPQFGPLHHDPHCR
jgi:hypothetical protein